MQRDYMLEDWELVLSKLGIGVVVVPVGVGDQRDDIDGIVGGVDEDDDRPEDEAGHCHTDSEADFIFGDGLEERRILQRGLVW